MTSPCASATSESPPKNHVQRAPTSTATKTLRSVHAGTRQGTVAAPNGTSNVNPPRYSTSTGSAFAKAIQKTANAQMTIKSSVGPVFAAGAPRFQTINPYLETIRVADGKYHRS